MKAALQHPWQRYGPGSLCRLDERFLSGLDKPREQARVILGACATVVVGTVAYGFVFGIWHSAEQALYSAIKLPLLFFAVVLASAVINTMLAQVLGSGLSLRQVCLAMLLGMSITAALLGAFSPVVLYFISQLPTASGQALHSAMHTYWFLLLFHVSLFAVCGIAGNVQLYRLLLAMTRCRAIAIRVLICWILTTGLVGCELSWIMSPFLAKPGVPVPFINPDAFDGNFFEYVTRAIMEAF